MILVDFIESPKIANLCFVPLSRSRIIASGRADVERRSKSPNRVPKGFTSRQTSNVTA